MVTFLESVDKCKSDKYIFNYFNNNNKDFLNFVKYYIEIDKIISNKTEISQIDINKEISNIKLMLTENSYKLSEIPCKIRDIKNISNNDDTIMSSMINNTLSNHSINDKINSIESTLNKFFHTGSAVKGKIAEELLGKLLNDTFKNMEIIDTHSKPHSGDFKLIMDNKPSILIDNKHFTGNVPKIDLQKFISDIQFNNCSGILCNVFGGIANKEHLEIDIIDNNIIVYIHEHHFNPDIFKVAVNIIYYISDIIKKNNNDEKIYIDKDFFNALKIEYNYFLKTFNEQLNIIKTSVNSLSQLHFNMIEQFFSKQANTTDNKKQIICNICGSNYATDKTLKQHIKNKHQFA